MYNNPKNEKKMGINLRKEAKVSLVKGQRINLTKSTEKDGEAVRFAFVGANWSALDNGDNVDLDSSVILYDENKNLLDVIYFGNLQSGDRAIRHSGDDREGDQGGDDGLDNEVITIDLAKINPKAHYVVSVLNNYTHQRFGDIPNIELRVYTNESGNYKDIDNVLASYKLDNNIEYSKFESIILGHFYKYKNQWKFAADGLGSYEKRIDEIATGSALNVCV